MHREQLFLDAIAATPDDQTLRLVYADWLEEQGDPRSELIRVEEEMVSLPPWSDRYWELKPRRNHLRNQVPSGWRELLRYGVDYLPTLRTIPDGWRERWRLTREFYERWYGVPVADIGGEQEAIAAVESRLERQLPGSVREWVAFHHELERHTRPPFRDICSMSWVPGHQAISLLQCEGDDHWGIRAADLRLEDPPVYGFTLEVEEEGEDADTFRETRCESESVSDWMVQRALWEARGESSFGVPYKDRAKLLQQLATVFPPPTRYHYYLVFEARNMLVCVTEWEARKDFRVEIHKGLPRQDIPAFFWEYTQNGGRFGGVFAERFKNNPPL